MIYRKLLIFMYLISPSFQKTNIFINLRHYTGSFMKIINWVIFLNPSQDISRIDDLVIFLFVM
jgi:hypothetical protein